LERALSKLGIASRSQARAWILSGRISVNHKIEKDPLTPVIPEKIFLTLDGKSLSKSLPRTILFYKPRGFVTTRSDEKGRPTVYSFLKDIQTPLNPVGRLDMATSGLLLFTNDNQLGNWLIDPNNKIVRTYLVTVSGRLTPEDVKQLKQGIEDKGELLIAKDVILQKASFRESHLLIKLIEGKNREIRRMILALGHDVRRLKRISFGGLNLGTLEPGQYREVSKEEIRKVFPDAPLKIIL